MIEKMTPCKHKTEKGVICNGQDFSITETANDKDKKIVIRAITCVKCKNTEIFSIGFEPLIQDRLAEEWNARMVQVEQGV